MPPPRARATPRATRETPGQGRKTLGHGCRSGGFEEIVEHALELVGVVGALGEFPLGVFEDAAQDEDAVAQAFQLLAGDDEFAFVQAEFGGPGAGLVVALATASSAVPPWAAGAFCLVEGATAPLALFAGFRHSDSLRPVTDRRVDFGSDLARPDSGLSLGRLRVVSVDIVNLDRKFPAGLDGTSA